MYEEDDILLDVRLWADAINGVGLPTPKLVMEMQKMGLELFTRNQNETWEWDKRQLIKMNITDLMGLYYKIKESS